METKDFLLLGIAGVLSYFLFKKKSESANSYNQPSSVKPSSTDNNVVKELDSKPIPKSALIENALTNCNVAPLVNEPTQVFGIAQLPQPYFNQAIVGSKYIDVVPTAKS